MDAAPRTTAFVVSLCLAAAAPRPAAAVDGVIEINQARALAGGVTATDTAGFPVTIDASGSYRLTGNLTVPNQNTTAIFVTSAALAVDIDLNGFAILGPVTCTAPPTVTCTQSGGGGRGIDQDGSVDSRLRVTHGAIRGMGSIGIFAGGALVVEDVEAMHNGGAGIFGSLDSQITGCEASRNGGNGIVVLATSTVRDSVASYNGLRGINAGAGAVVEHNRVVSNGDGGIAVHEGCAVLDNTSRNNTNEGIDFFAGVSGYARNVLTGNNGGDANPQVSGGGVGIQTGTNICGTDTVCP